MLREGLWRTAQFLGAASALPPGSLAELALGSRGLRTRGLHRRRERPRSALGADTRSSRFILVRVSRERGYESLTFAHTASTTSTAARTSTSTATTSCAACRRADAVTRFFVFRLGRCGSRRRAHVDVLQRRLPAPHLAATGSRARCCASRGRSLIVTPYGSDIAVPGSPRRRPRSRSCAITLRSPARATPCAGACCGSAAGRTS